MSPTSEWATRSVCQSQEKWCGCLLCCHNLFKPLATDQQMLTAMEHRPCSLMFLPLNTGDVPSFGYISPKVICNIVKWCCDFLPMHIPMQHYIMWFDKLPDMCLVIQPEFRGPSALDVTASRNLSDMAHQHMGISVAPVLIIIVIGCSIIKHPAIGVPAF